MDTVVFHSTLTFKPILFKPAPANPISSSLCNLTLFRKLRGSSSIAVSVTPSNRQPSSSNRNNSFRGLVNALRNVKGLIFSRAQEWASSVEAYSGSKGIMGGGGGGTDGYLKNGGIGVALLSVTSNAKVKISPFVATLASNPAFVSGLFAWFVAQSIKVILNFFIEKKWDLRMFFASGGMPSSHSALCTALTTSVALCHGVADSLFPVCLGFSSIVMYDAIGVRRHAGMQAEVLNIIVEDLFEGHPISQRKLKELLGHTPSQVFAGAVLGIFVAWICCRGCLVAT